MVPRQRSSFLWKARLLTWWCNIQSFIKLQLPKSLLWGFFGELSFSRGSGLVLCKFLFISQPPNVLATLADSTDTYPNVLTSYPNGLAIHPKVLASYPNGTDAHFNGTHSLFDSPATFFDVPAKLFNTPAMFFDSPAKLFNSPAAFFNVPAKLFNAPATFFDLPASALPSKSVAGRSKKKVLASKWLFLHIKRLFWPKSGANNKTDAFKVGE